MSSHTTCIAQARALALSTLLTGVLGVAGFYVLKEYKFFSTDRAELPSAKEAARLLRNPRVRRGMAVAPWRWFCRFYRNGSKGLTK